MSSKDAAMPGPKPSSWRPDRTGHSRGGRPNDGAAACRCERSEKGAERHGTGKLGAARPAPPASKAVLPDDIAVKLLYVNFEDQMEFPEARVQFFPNGTCDEFTDHPVVARTLNSRSAWTSSPRLANVKQIR